MGIRQFVTFRIDGHLLGIDIAHVREINRFLDITDVPRTLPHVLGLINLRGQTVTVFDLGLRLGLAARRITDESHNVIFKTANVGLLVDRIGDVVTVNEAALDLPPANLNGIGGEFVAAVVQVETELLVVLSPEKLLAPARRVKSDGPGPWIAANQQPNQGLHV